MTDYESRVEFTQAEYIELKRESGHGSASEERGGGMKSKELLKLIYEVKGYYTGIIDALVDFEGINLVLSKSELEKLASRLIEKEVAE